MLGSRLNGFGLFFTKDRDSFEDCLRENDVIPSKSKRDRLKKCVCSIGLALC